MIRTKPRLYKVELIAEVDSETVAEGLKKVRESFKIFNVLNVKPLKSKRTEIQNRALWLLFTELADELNSKGLDMRTLIREKIELSWTPYTVNEYLWKPLLKVLTGKKSTTQMEKTKDIDLVYKNLNRILIERTRGEVSLPPFPSIEELERSGDKK